MDDGEPCIRQNLLEEILGGATDSYRLVHQRPDFEEELRNPLYTDILILGNRHRLTDHLTGELREKVYRGNGLISAGFLLSGDYEPDNGRKTHDSILGVKGLGVYDHGNSMVVTENSPITASGEFEIKADSWKVETGPDTLVAGWLTGNSNKETYPAIVLNEFGRGRAVYFSFDYGTNLDDAHYGQMAELLKETIGHVHLVDTEQTLLPFDMPPVEIGVESPGRAFDLKFIAEWPEELKIYDAATGEWHTDGLWEPILSVEAGGMGYLSFNILAPDRAGSYEMVLKSFVTENDQEYLLQRDIFGFEVSASRDELLAALISALDSLNLAGNDRATVRKIAGYLEQVRYRIVLCENHIEKNIRDLDKAITALTALPAGIDIKSLRFELDKLLKIEQSKWYFYTGPVCEDEN
jgi:hypothetical protein